MASTSLSAPAEGVASHASPVDVTERLTLIDALRGFALCGVLVANSFVWFSGRALIPPARAEALAGPPLEKVVSNLFQLFVHQKFLAIFAFLFGLGFSIQLTRAEARGASIVPLYTRRLLVLLGFGLVHLFALWSGDILHTYAIAGFLLLAFRQRDNRTLVLWAVALLGVAPLLIPALQRFVPVWLHGEQAAEVLKEAAQTEEATQRADLLAALSSDSFWTSQSGNARYSLETFFRSNRALVFSLIVGRFLLGLLAGRLRVLHDVERHRKWLRRTWVGGLVLGLLITLPGLVVMRLKNARIWTPPDDVGMFLLNNLQDVGYLFLSAAFVSLFALLFQRPFWRRVLGLLAPVGRMALSNYLAQTLICIAIYDGWGLGLVGNTPASLSVAIALGIFAAQVVFSHLWFKSFRFGPAEWLWRVLTYGGLQPIHHESHETTAPVST
ncbi:DUF418 domain-containing protein [Myxococcus sp. K15C18031901]|uniref:DUF418 domain-containing protein n=1 Tax=Myxococcus dinghuensis TaxID=2906761 RepID=UPI0020A709D0|nr:DUF418 domain-containing protein [Myxococcus dinghuensis]MCP3102875.1 DUF418 domain-containing protein [Myxococcus dinghuensis]